MLVVTSENVAGCRVATTLGECFGIVVRTRGAATAQQVVTTLQRCGADPAAVRRPWPRGRLG